MREKRRATEGARERERKRRGRGRGRTGERRSRRRTDNEKERVCTALAGTRANMNNETHMIAQGVANPFLQQVMLV